MNDTHIPRIYIATFAPQKKEQHLTALFFFMAIESLNQSSALHVFFFFSL